MRGRTIISTCAAANLSGIYWFFFFLLGETWTASDYRAGTAPGETWPMAEGLLILLSGPILIAFMIGGWRKLEHRLSA